MSATKKLRLLSLVTVLVLLMSMLPMSAMAATTTKYVKTTNGLSLNVRSSMKTRADNVIGHLAYGTKVTVLRSSGGWSYISASGMKGYVVSANLVSTNPGKYGGSRTMYVYSKDGKSVNLRSSCQIRTENVVTQVPFGAKVTIYNQVGNWTRIKYGSYTGYIQTAYLVHYKPSR